MKTFDSSRFFYQNSDKGIVRTPEELAQEMISNIPEYIFESSTTTFLDPACGRGTFLIQITKKLKGYGHSWENITSRIFGIDIDPFSGIKQAQYILGSKNIIVQDFLEMSLPSNWPKEFDVIVSNPPYGGGSVGGRGAGSGKSIWQFFVTKSFTLLNETGKMCFIHPEDWRSSVPGAAKVKGEKMEKEKAFSLLTSGMLTNLRMWGNTAFPGVGTDVDSWVLDKAYSGPCKVEYTDGSVHNISLSKNSPVVGLSPSSLAFSILNKATTKNQSNGILLRKSWSGLKVLDTNSPQGEYAFAHGSKWTSGEWRTEEYPHIHQRSNKVIVCEIRLPRAKYFTSEESVGISDHVHYWLVKNNIEGKNLEFFCNSNVVNYIRLKTYPLIMPYWIWDSFNVDFKFEIKDDQDVYRHLGISSEEIKEIENFLNDSGRKETED
jgi:hypothetical protein